MRVLIGNAIGDWFEKLPCEAAGSKWRQSKASHVELSSEAECRLWLPIRMV